MLFDYIIGIQPMIQPALFTYFLSPACCRSPTIIYFMTMKSQRLRRSKLNSLYSRRRAFEDDASSLLTTISSQFRRHLSRRNVHFLQLACCARKFARECRTNHWTLCASYAHRPTIGYYCQSTARATANRDKLK